LRIETTINPAANTALEGLYVSGGRSAPMRTEGFRKITYALDRPDSLSRYSTRIDADKARYRSALQRRPTGARRSAERAPLRAVARSASKPVYLFALVAAISILWTIHTMTGKVVKLGIHVDKGDGPRAAYAMDSLKRAMKWDEEVFKREYDLEYFQHRRRARFQFGAMENKGLNVFNSAYVLAIPIPRRYGL